MANRTEAVGRCPEHLPVGAIRVGGSSAHYDQAVRFYRDLVGLPLLESFAASYGEDGTIFGLSDTAVHLEIVRSAAPAVRADGVDMLVLTPARACPSSTAHRPSSQFPGAEMVPVMVSKSVPAVRSAPPFQVRWPVAAAKRPVPPMIGPETRYVTTPAVDVV